MIVALSFLYFSRLFVDERDGLPFKPFPNQVDATRALSLEIPFARSVHWVVRVAELKRAVDDLSLDERLEVADYLRRRAKQDDPQWEAELGKRLDRCLEGKGHPAEELLALHERLSS